MTALMQRFSRTRRLHTLNPVRALRHWCKWHIWRMKLRRRGSFAHSSWASLLLRPLLEKRGFLSLIGVQLASATLMGTAMLHGLDPDTATSQAPPTFEMFADEHALVIKIDSTTSLKTEESKAIQIPVTHFTGVSQWYGYFHPGLDIRSPLNHDVVAMKTGTVKEVIHSRHGYGRHIILSHGDGLETLYAHLNGIFVEAGESVVAGQRIGQIGMSGWTTGPHLHFETRQDGRQVNPVGHLEPAFDRLKTASATGDERTDILADNRPL